MSTKEEIEAAIFIIRSKPTIANQYDAAADRLANLVMAEQAERQRRIEAAAAELAAMFIIEPKENIVALFAATITRHLDGKTT